MNNITLKRSVIMALDPCDHDAALSLWEQAIGVDEIELEWTPLHACWLAMLDGAGPNIGALGWLEGFAVVPQVLRGADLSGADLRGAYLRGADLSGADLRAADLRGADLSDANLRSANLSGADLRGADLRCANLRCANLRDAVGHQAD